MDASAPLSPDFVQHQILELHEAVDTVTGALSSLDPKTIGAGLATYRPGINKFEPRTSYFQNSPTYTKITNVHNKDATCSNFIAGLEHNLRKTTQINNNIKFLRDHGQADKLDPIIAKIKDLQLIIATNTSPCLEQIIQKYEAKDKNRESIERIKSATASIFKNIGSIDTSRVPCQKELPNLPMPDKSQAAKHIVGLRDGYLKSLSLVNNNMCNAVIVPQQLVQDCQNDAKLKPVVGKESLKDEAVKQRLFETVYPLPTLHKSTWMPFAISKNASEITVKEDSVIPTCIRHDNAKEVNHLANLYIQVDPAGQNICLTCGGIDSLNKADEFIEGLKIALAKCPPQDKKRPLRLMLNQLNSFFTDGELIHDQHHLSRYVETRLRETLTEEFLADTPFSMPPASIPIVAHMNTALNFASTLTSEELRSNIQNLDGLAAISCWLGVSMPLPSVNVIQQTDDAKLLRLQIISCKSRIYDLEKYISECDPTSRQTSLMRLTEENKTLNALQKQLKDTLQNIAHESGKAIASMSMPGPLQPESKKALLAWKIFSLIVAKQTAAEGKLGLPEINRTTELELHFLLNMLLHPISEMNCKSGLDRTGFARAIWDSLRTLHKAFASNDGPGENVSPAEAEANAFQHVFDLVLNQDKHSAELDAIQAVLMKEKQLSSCIALDLDSLSDKPAKSYRTMLIDAIHDIYKTDLSKIESLVNALRYQDLVATHLFSVAQPITLSSTGAAGLKYGYDAKYTASVEGNPHPLKRLPMCISTETGKVIQLYTTNWTFLSDDNLWKGTWQMLKGAPPTKRFITHAGIDLLVRNSSLRGA